MSERGYKVRIRPPERGDVGMLVAMIGPLVELDSAALSRALANGPAIVGDDMARGEAEQLMGVFTSLGADAELLLPDGSVNEPEPLSENNTLPLHAKGIAAALDAVTGRNPTQPFDTRALRQKVEQASQQPRQPTTPPVGSTISQTQPFNPRALRAAAAKLQAGEDISGPIPSDRAPSTRPMEISPSLRRVPVLTSEDGAVGLPAPRTAQGSQLSTGARPAQSSSRPPSAQERSSVPPAGLPLRGSAPPRGRPIRSGAPTPGRRPSSLPPPVKLEGLPPLEPDDVVDSVNTASLAFTPNGSNPPISVPPGPVTGSHPQPDRSRGEAIRDKVVEAQTTPVPHSVGWAVALAVVLPGMGQLYNGQRNRAVWFAVGALLVLPWIVSIFDAASVARAIRERRERPPHPVSRRAAFPGQLVLDFAVFVALAGGLTLVLHAFEQKRLTDPAQPIARNGAQNVASGAPNTQAPSQPTSMPAPATQAPVTQAPATQAPATLAPVIPASVTSVQPASTQPASVASAAAASKPIAPKPVDIDTLLAQGRTACGEGRFADCEALMQKIIERDPQHREAHQLRVDAISQQGTRARRSSPTSVAPVNPVP